MENKNQNELPKVSITTLTTASRDKFIVSMVRKSKHFNISQMYHVDTLNASLMGILVKNEILHVKTPDTKPLL